MTPKFILETAHEWTCMTTAILDLKEIDLAIMRELFYATYRILTFFHRRNDVPRDVCRLVLNMDEFLWFATMIDESPVSKYYGLLYHITTALKRGFLYGAYDECFPSLKIVDDHKNMRVIDFESCDLKDYANLFEIISSR